MRSSVRVGEKQPAAFVAERRDSAAARRRSRRVSCQLAQAARRPGCPPRRRPQTRPRRRHRVGATAESAEGATVRAALEPLRRRRDRAAVSRVPYVWARRLTGRVRLLRPRYVRLLRRSGVSLPHSSYAMWNYGVAGAEGSAPAGRHRLLRRPRPRRDLRRQRRVRRRAPYGRVRPGLEPRRGSTASVVRRRPAHSLAIPQAGTRPGEAKPSIRL